MRGVKVETRRVGDEGRSINHMSIHLSLSWLVCACVIAMPSRARAQSAPGDDVCLGFSFGAWTPLLDWRAAGHGDPPSEKTLQHAPSGRDWASDLATGQDSTLFLFPAWWPAGVAVVFPHRALAVGDTVRGRAT